MTTKKATLFELIQSKELESNLKNLNPPLMKLKHLFYRMGRHRSEFQFLSQRCVIIITTLLYAKYVRKHNAKL